MLPISKQQYEVFADKYKYLKGRFEYYEQVINLISPEWESCLEIGPGFCPVVLDSDLMDIKQRTSEFEITYLHDIRKTPWPVDKEYDLIIALQVWEHLDGFQKICFREARSHANNIILSLPYKWTNSYADHNGIDLNVIFEWTGTNPSKYIIVGKNQRIVCFYADVLQKRI